RIVALARRLEHIAAVDLIALQIAGLAGHADLVFGLLVEWLQHRIGQGPVSERAFLRDRSEAISLDGVRARAKIVLMQAPRYGAIVDGAPARWVAVVLRGNPPRPFVPFRPPRHWLPFHIWPQVLPLEIAQLVKLEIRGLQPWTTLQPDHLEAGLAELGRHDAADSAHSDDDHISLFGCHGSCSLGIRPGLGLQAGDGRTSESLFARKIGRRVIKLRARKADQLPAGEVLVAPINRVGEQTFHRMGAQRVEERLSGRERELARLALL